MRKYTFDSDDWRSTVHGDVVKVYFVKRFSFFPRRINGTLVWLKPYYSEYISILGHASHFADHTEDEYLMLKLSGDA